MKKTFSLSWGGDAWRQLCPKFISKVNIASRCREVHAHCLNNTKSAVVSVGRAIFGLCEAGSGQLAQRSDPPGNSEQDRVVVVLLEVVVP